MSRTGVGKDAAVAGAALTSGCGCVLVAIALKLAVIGAIVYVVIRVARAAWGTP